MKFFLPIIATFVAMAAAGQPLWPNMVARGAEGCGAGCGAQPQDPCCQVQGCCYPCKEGSDADCAPEVPYFELL